jgi:KDO2-lipid IV(A) lauroyltransferase
MIRRLNLAQPSKKQEAFIHPRYWGNWLLVALLWCLAQLPFAVAMACGRGLGHLARGLMKSRQRVVLTNLKLCFPQMPEPERVQLMRETFTSFGQGVVAAAISWWGSDKYLKKLTYRVTGVEHLQACVATKQPAMLISPHLYTLEIGGRILSQYVPFGVFYQHQSSHFFDQFMRRKREAYFSHVIDRRNLKQFMRLVQQGELLSYAPDQDFGPINSVFAPFFNVPTATASSTARIAKRCQAKLMFFNCLITKHGFEVIISPVLEQFPTGDAVADATTINAKIEEVILTDKSNYMWLHKRFKTRPEGEKNVYAASQ